MTPPSRVSVVVPFYNAEAWLPRCLEMLLGQTRPPLEIVAVDDGSRDAGVGLADDYARRHASVTVVHQPNAGPGAARNAGIRAAKGEFLFFMDVDDAPAPHALETLEAAMLEQPCDFCVGDYTVTSGGVATREGVYQYPDSRRFGPDGVVEAVREFLRRPRGASWLTNVWGRLYRRALIVDRGLSFAEDLSTWEDTIFNFDYLRHARSAYYCREALYHYQTRVGTASDGARVCDASLGFLRVIESATAALRDAGDDEGAIQALAGRAAVYLAVRVLVGAFALSLRSGTGDAGDKARLRQLIRLLANHPDIRAGLRGYRAGPGESAAIPFLMRWRLYGLVGRVCRYKVGRNVRRAGK